MADAEMSDIVEKLRADIEGPELHGCIGCAEILMHEAADEIERLQAAKRRALAIADERSKENVELRAENERLRAALGTAIAAMEIASALPEVEAEYDFSHAIKTAWAAYGHDGDKRKAE